MSATQAGYADRTAGSALLRNPRVIKAIQQMMHDAIGVHAVAALHTVSKLAKSARSDYVRLEAARDLLDRAGYKPPDKQLVKLAGDLTVSFDISPEGHQIEGHTDSRGGSKTDAPLRELPSP